MRRSYLRIGDDTLDDANGYNSVAAAGREFHRVATSLWRYGQRIEATIHIAPSRKEVVEYPDFVLSLGPRGGLKCERA